MWEEVQGTGQRAVEPRGRGAELFELGYPGSSPHPSLLLHSIAGLILITRQTTGQGAAGHKSENPGLGTRVPSFNSGSFLYWLCELGKSDDPSEPHCLPRWKGVVTAATSSVCGENFPSPGRKGLHAACGHACVLTWELPVEGNSSTLQ